MGLPVVLVLATAALGAAYLMVVADAAWILSAGLVLSVFSGQWDALDVPVALDRAVLLAGVVAVLARIGPQRDRPPLELGATHLLLLAATVFALCSSLWVGTLDSSDARFRLVDSFGIAPFALFTVAPLAFRTARQRAILLGALVALGAYLAITALAEATGADGLVVPSYILDPQYGIHADRARGPFVEAVANGVALFACAVAAGVARHVWTDRRARGAATAVAVLCLAAIPVTYTRAVWIGAVAGLVVVLVAAAPLRRLAVPSLVGAAAALALAVLVIPGFGDRLDARSSAKGPVWVRENLNDAALRLTGEHPVAGVGWERFVPASYDAFRIVGDVPPDAGVGEPAHNLLLARTAELGLLGGALWLAAVLAGIGGALTRRVVAALEPWRAGLLAIVVCWATVAALGPAEYPFPLLLLWTWAGVVRARAA